MKYLQILNLALLALGLSLTIVLAVECLLYAIYLGADPVVARQLPDVLTLTVLLAVFAAAAFVAYVGHRLQKGWRWPAQALPFLAAGGVIVGLVAMSKG